MTADAPVAFVFNLGAALPLVALLVSAFLGAYVFGASARVSSAYPYFAPVFGLWMFTGVALFVRSYWRVRKGPSQRMIGVVLGGLLLGTVPAAVTELLWPLLSASDTRVGLGSLYTPVWSIFIPYAVARYRYLD